MKLPKMIERNFEPHFALKHMLKDMVIAGRLGLDHHLELAVTTAARDRLLEQEQRGYAEEDFSVIVRKYFPELQMPVIEQDLELFEKPPPIEPAATISSMGEVAASVQPDAELPAPPIDQPAAAPEPQFVPFTEPSGGAPGQSQPAGPDTIPQEAPTKPQNEQSEATNSPMDMLAKLLRGESIHPDQS
jgi:hypothetical protein